jgi:hypothetical protein
VTAGLTELIANQRKQREAAELEALHAAQLKAARKGNPALYEQAHFLDADDDTAFPLPGVAHPKPTTEVTA